MLPILPRPALMPAPDERPPAAALARRPLMLASLSALCLPAWAGSVAQAAAGTALVPDDVLADYARFLSGRDPLKLRDYGGPHSRRDVVELLLLLQALATSQAMAESPRRLTFQAMPTDARLQRELRAGRALCSATSYWAADVAEPRRELLLSAALVQDGEFEAGLYTLPSHRQALACRSLEEVRRLRILSNRDWRVDWQTLQGLGVYQLLHVGNWRQMPRMLESGRADALLAPFQAGDDLSLQVEGVRLVPIPGLKIAMHGTRHYLISASHPQAAQLRQQLDVGLGELRRQGLLQQAYQQSGFFNARVRQWQRL